jgi:serine phosphatase RsbU (regulator of sigma subunit)
MPVQDVISQLLQRGNVSAPDLLLADLAAAAGDAGAEGAVLYVVDYAQEQLSPVSLARGLVDEAPDDLTVAGTMAGRTFQTQQVISAQSDGGWRVWSPVRERADRLGVLELTFPHIDDEILRLAEDLGRLVGHLIRTASRYTDAIELTRRKRRMNLPAEMQWDMLLPPLAFRSPDVAIAALLEPAYDVGGDGFDYALNGDELSFAMLDAMGHGLTSTLASTLAMAGFRNGRRAGRPLIDIAKQIDEALISQFGGESFVTGHIAFLDTASGHFSWLNAGHPDPLLVRGSRVVSEPHAEPCFPFGLGIQIVELGEMRLEPGDRLLFYSDGVIEAKPDLGEQFGIERLRDRIERHLTNQLPPAEILRRIVKEVLAHRAGPLRDDATLVMIEWRPSGTA